jgi:hypothetical protein
MDPAVYDALARWAADEFRSVNAQIELLVRRALSDAGRMPKQAAPPPRRGRPPAGARGRHAEGDRMRPPDEGNPELVGRADRDRR